MLTLFAKSTIKKAVIVGFDFAMTIAAVIAALNLRLDDRAFSDRLSYAPFVIPFALFAVGVYAWFNLYRSKWRFASIPDLIAIAKASLALSIILLAIDYTLVAQNLYGGYFFGRQALIIYCFLQMAFLGGPRMLYRAWKDSRLKNQRKGADTISALLIGRGVDVEPIIRGIELGSIRRITAEGILSPRSGDQGQSIRGVAVLGTVAALEQSIIDMEARQTPIKRVILTPFMLEQDQHPEKLLERCRRLGIPAVRMRSLDDGMDGRLAPVEIEDLLLRPTVKIERAPVESFVGGKRVLVTGGGGSIGSEICRRLQAFGASAILVIEQSEPALHDIIEALRAENGTALIDGHLCNIRDRDRLFRLMHDFAPDVVFHAAALKHVPYLERDWSEAIKTNIFGSVNVVEAAVAAQAKVFVMISSDKAIRPVSVLGASKRFAERVTETVDGETGSTRLISVRFGNVLGSSGSVVPIFKQQIARGGPVTVTHRDMIRYFMTVREACDLVLTAAAHAVDESDAGRASVYVLKMGQPVRIADLADRMIRLSGLEPGRDIDVVETGMRPGERLHEILFDQDETMVETRIDGIMAARTPAAKREDLTQWLGQLRDAVATGDAAAAEAVLRIAIPEYRPNGGGGPSA